MLDFLKAFLRWLNEHNLVPSEVEVTDVGEDRNNKTFLMNLPEDVPNVVCIRQYNMRLAPLVAKDACVRYIQIIVRNEKHEKAIQDIENIFNFLKVRPDFIEDISEDYWVIIDCTTGPAKMDEDSQGRYLYSLSVPITTKS